MSRRDRFIKTKMEEHLKYLSDKGYNVVALFLQGSQNYGTDIYTKEYSSDVDTKAIVLPSLDDIIKGKMISHTHVMPDNSHIDIKDVRVMTDMWCKQNISYLELLYTKYYAFNDDYKTYVGQLRTLRDDIAEMHFNQLLRCIKGMSGNKVAALEHPYPTLIEKIEKYGYDNKQLLHIVRLNDFTKQLLGGAPMSKCYIPKKGTLKMISRIRQNYYSLERAREIADKYDKSTTALIDSYIKKHSEKIDVETKKKLEDLQLKIIKYALVQEAGGYDDKTE